MERMLRESRDIRDGQQELGRTLRALNDTLVSITRTRSNLDRRIPTSQATWKPR
jgi:predicted component of type VI protein secretion system